jgi:hypothetical protein
MSEKVPQQGPQQSDANQNENESFKELESILEENEVVSEERVKHGENIAKGMKEKKGKDELDKQMEAVGIKGDTAAQIKGSMEFISTSYNSNNPGLTVKLVSRHFKKELEKNKDSIFLGGAYALCVLLERYFDFSMTAGDYSGAIRELYPEEKFEKKDLKKIMKKRRILPYIIEYKEAQKAKDTVAEFEARDALIKALRREDIQVGDKEHFEALLDSDLLKIADQIYNSYSEQLPPNVIESIGNSETRISAYYVNRELVSLGSAENLQPGSDDSEKLYGRLLQTARKDSETKQTYSFDFEEDFGAFLVNSSVPGTVAFFSATTPKGKPEILAGIVGADGVFRMQVSTGLHSFPDFGVGMTTVLNSPEYTRGLRDAQNSITALFSGIYSATSAINPEYKFRGAFIPAEKEVIDEVKKKKEEEDEKKEEIEKRSESLKNDINAWGDRIVGKKDDKKDSEK